MAEWSLRHRMLGGDPGPSELGSYPNRVHLGMPGSPMVLQILLRISQAVLGASFLDEALEAIAEETRIVMRGSSVSISRWEPEIDSVRTLITVGQLGRGELRWPDAELYRVRGDRQLTELLQYGRPYAYSVDDPDIGPAALAELQQLGKESAVAVPLAYGDTVWGEMWVTGSAGRRFDHDDIQLLQAIASYATVAIGKAELFSATWKDARQDPLTGLANRRALDERMSKIEWSDARHTALVCDLDGFKLINDREGHAAGDELLSAFANILSAAVAQFPDAMVARLGGDEFCVLLPNIGIPDAENLVNSVNAAMESRLAGRVAATWGAAEHTGVGVTGWELLHAADLALQHAKSLGRNRFSYITAPQIIPGDSSIPGGRLTDRVVDLLEDQQPASPLAALEILARQAQRWIGAAGWEVLVTDADTNTVAAARSLDDRPAIAQSSEGNAPLVVEIPAKGDRSGYAITLYAKDNRTPLATINTELRVLAHYCVSITSA